MVDRERDIDRTAQSPVERHISDTGIEVMLTEYKCLRDEMLKRMDHRIALIVASLTVTGAMLALGIERDSGSLLLLTPLVSVIFGLLVLYHTKMVADITRYIGAYIERPIQGDFPECIGWVTKPAWRGVRFREIRTVLHLPMILAVVGPSVASLAISWEHKGSLASMIPLAALDLILLGLYLTQYARRVSSGMFDPGR